MSIYFKAPSHQRRDFGPTIRKFILIGLISGASQCHAIVISTRDFTSPLTTIAGGHRGRFLISGFNIFSATRATIGMLGRGLASGYGGGVELGATFEPGEVASMEQLLPYRNERCLGSFTTPAAGAVHVMQVYSVGPAEGSREFRSPSGPLWALSDGIAEASGGTAKILCEVRPLSGPRSAVIITVPFDGLAIATMREYPLPAGMAILDRLPTPDGGFVFLTGTEEAAFSNYIGPDGTIQGPFFVGPAQQIAYSPANGGTILTAGRTAGGNMFFTRGRITGPFVDSRAEAHPFLNTGFSFKGWARGARGESWWCGGYTTILGDSNGFILSTEDSSLMETRGADIVGSTASDESANSILVEPGGVGAIAADGVVQIREMETARIMASYPPTPDPAIHYSEVTANMYAPGRNRDLDAGDPFSHFGAIGEDTRTGVHSVVAVRLQGELRRATVGSPEYVGGVTPTMYVQMYEPEFPNIAFSLSSNSANARVPAAIQFADFLKRSSVTISTSPVAAAEDIEITVESATRPVVARFRLLPPAPYFFTPSSLTLRGGTSGILRLSLNGKAPTGGLPVALSSDGPQAIPPASVLVPAGLYSRSFVVRTTPVAVTANRTITATYAGATATAPVIVTP